MASQKKLLITCKKNPSLADETAMEINNDPNFAKKMAKAINENTSLKLRAEYRDDNNKLLVLSSALNSEPRLVTTSQESHGETEAVNSGGTDFVIQIVGSVISTLISAAILYAFNQWATNQQQAQQAVVEENDIEMPLRGNQR
ncbi:MAG: hypothetical protein NT086_06865 [Proteobacteria bacterium]|nr:hypothetical protein [Pseudomonadota bacterium]